MFDDFYGLDGRPFQLTPDPAFYFESNTHRKALSYLGYGLAQGEGFVVITGEVGAGKSTLVAHLMATIDPNRMTAANVVTSALDGEEIVHVVAQSFGLSVAGHDKASALGTLEAFFHDEARAGRRCLLIVDEAQNLAIGALEELRMLSNFQLGSHPLLQTLLLGQPEFRQTLLESDQLEQLRQRVIATHHLGPMEAREMRPYIEHRLSRVGWNGNPAFDPALFPAIHEATGGIPRRINQLVNRLLLLGAVDRRDQLDPAMLEQVLNEMAEDGALSVVTPSAKSRTAVNEPHAAAEGVQRHAVDPGQVERIVEVRLADRDAQIADLRNALAELSAATLEQGGTDSRRLGERITDLEARLAEAQGRTEALEARLAETDRTLRHTLTMLIEWIESGDGERKVA